ncbi:hypothetical protein RUM44_006069 [Polyplax serrata]|uniref:Uncharacterized protein n=1 Tax=Polyplax serrata TaxID=468196 RepID=A0ABR1AZC4_POLSC
MRRVNRPHLLGISERFEPYQKSTLKSGKECALGENEGSRERVRDSERIVQEQIYDTEFFLDVFLHLRNLA